MIDVLNLIIDLFVFTSTYYYIYLMFETDRFLVIQDNNQDKLI